MTVLSDKWIKEMVKNHKIIDPFIDKQVRGTKISYGLSSFGYDARVSNEFKVFLEGCCIWKNNKTFMFPTEKEIAHNVYGRVTLLDKYFRHCKE